MIAPLLFCKVILLTMLDINRILPDNHLTQVFTGLNRTQCSQLFPHFVQAYKAQHPDWQRPDACAQGGNSATLAGEYNQLFFILFCFRWQPELTLLGDLFGLSRSQASWWIHHLKPVLLRVYKPNWDRNAADLPPGQLQSMGEIIERFPAAQQAIIADNTGSKVGMPTRIPLGTAVQQPSLPIPAENGLSRLLPKRLKPYGPLILPAAAAATAVVIAGLPVLLFLQGQAQLTPAESQLPQSIEVSPLPAGQSSQAPIPSAPSTAIASPEPSEPADPSLSAPLESRPYEDVPVTADLSGLSLYNHLVYPEADPSRIVSVGLFIRESYEREEFLDYEAAQAFFDMKAAAAQQGVKLIPISGFREIARQQKLFAEQVEKLGSEEAAARLSAPPGHSEHHTGYALDIGDADRPDADIKYDFENTQAYIWLQANAQAFGFEESFPKHNRQNVSFEPWHWRYVGSQRAESTFVVSKTMFP